ncbi:MAG: FAD-dependent oxidoreductase [Fimbriimonas sp.]|nr:FAD-dependent oxidoreductase [Fimbriimonas sp.]
MNLHPVANDDPRNALAFPILTEAQIAALSQFGAQRHIEEGASVWLAGTPNMCLYLVVQGEMTILDGRSGRPVARHVKGEFSGDIDIITGRSTVVSAHAASSLDVVEVPADCVRSIVEEEPELGEILLRAFLLRRQLLQGATDVGPLVVGSRFSPDTLRIREFLARNRLPFSWDDLESSRDTNRLIAEFGVTEDETPIVVLPSGAVIRSPSNAELGNALGIARRAERKVYDLVIVGAGPAGLAAAVYGASEGLSTLILDSIGPGGQAGTSSRIENYMGFPLGLTGQALADSGVAQAEKFGARMLAPARATGIECDSLGGHLIGLDNLEPVTAKCVLLACGASYRKLDVLGNEHFEGRGIYYSATHIERILCGSRAVAVIGAGNSAGQAAVYMSEHAKHVFLIVRGDDLRKTMSSYLARRIEQSPKIGVHLCSEICKLEGSDHLESIEIVDRRDGGTTREEVAGVFVMIGAVPHTGWLPETVSRDEKGFILTGPSVETSNAWKAQRTPYYLETSCPGVFAAGDARAGSVKRVASAVGEGSMAVTFVHQFLA